MQAFIDLQGASGVTYRFQRVEDVSRLPAIAGNFVYVRGEGPKPVVICCGTDETLLNAASGWPAALQSHKVKAMYVRKNISWKVRASEHEDIVERHQPPMVVATELDRRPSWPRAAA